MVFSKDAVNGCWKWGEYSLPIVSPYSNLGIAFYSNGAWDMHIKKLLEDVEHQWGEPERVNSFEDVLWLILHARLTKYAESANFLSILVYKVIILLFP